LVELLIDRVVVTDEEVEIRYVIPTSPRGEHRRFCHLRLDYFDLPMPPCERAQPGGVRDIRRQTGDAVAHRPLGCFPCLPASFHHEDLRHPRPIEVRIQLRRGRHPAMLVPPVPLLLAHRCAHVPRGQAGGAQGGVEAAEEASDGGLMGRHLFEAHRPLARRHPAPPPIGRWRRARGGWRASRRGRG